MRRTLARCREQVSILSVPMNLGQPNLGLDRAPLRIIDGGLPSLLGDIGWRVKQVPQLYVDTNLGGSKGVPAGLKAKNCLGVGKGCEAIHNLVKDHCGNETFPLILGGDHCIGIGTIAAIKGARKKAGIVWVDAHGDINTPKGSNSGNMHGMPVAFLMGLVEEANKLPGFEWFKPVMTPQDIVYIGLRDLDNDEKRTIKQLGIRAYSMYDVDRLGIGRVMEETNDYFKDREDVHLSFDIDAIDPFYAPHTGTAVTGGLTYREGNYICEALFDAGNLSSMELVEVDPSQHSGVEDSKTIDVALTLIGSAMGKRIL